MYLVDTNVLSASSPAAGRSGEHDRVVAWLRLNEHDIFVSTITVAEIEAGIARARRRGATRKADDIERWWRDAMAVYENRMLSFDIEAAVMAGQLFDAAVGRGHSPGFEDAAIAGSAKRHGYCVVTRNVRHFDALGVTFINPY